MADERDRIYAAPVAEEASPGEPAAVAADHLRLCRVHLVAWLVCGLLVVVTGAGLAFELWTPEVTLGADAYSEIHGLHAAGGLAVLLVPVGGLAALLVLPRRLGRPGFHWQWLAYVSVAVWPVGALILLFAPATVAYGLFGAFVGIAALVSGLAALAGMHGIELLASRTRWKDAPLLVAGVGTGAVLQLLAFARSTLQFLGPRLGIQTFGSGLDYLIPLVYPVVFGIAADMLERVGGKPLPRIPIIVAIVVVGVSAWLPESEGRAVLAMLVGIVAGIAALLLWLRLPSRSDPRAIAAVAAVELATIGWFAFEFIAGLSVDVHLRDTYFVTAQVHLAGGASVLVLLAVLLDWPRVIARVPHPRSARIGTILFSAGLALFAFAQFALGQQGMPRRYVTYVGQFTDLMRISFVAACIPALGLAVLVVAYARGSECSSSPD